MNIFKAVTFEASYFMGKEHIYFGFCLVGRGAK